MRLKGAVVVITGASSGREATALAFARRGARLELGARRLIA
jgi:NADP-dependent 3-hydroxy acid dehydrogenase YdfG